jgi:hypothetical protein
MGQEGEVHHMRRLAGGASRGLVGQFGIDRRGVDDGGAARRVGPLAGAQRGEGAGAHGVGDGGDLDRVLIGAGQHPDPGKAGFLHGGGGDAADLGGDLTLAQRIGDQRAVLGIERAQVEPARAALRDLGRRRRSRRAGARARGRRPRGLRPRACGACRRPCPWAWPCSSVPPHRRRRAGSRGRSRQGDAEIAGHGLGLLGSGVGGFGFGAGGEDLRDPGHVVGPVAHLGQRADLLPSR